MKGRGAKGGLLVLALALSAGVRGEDAAGTGGVEVRVEPSSWDVGAVIEGERFRRDFLLRPAGGAGAVEVETVWAPCGDCLSVKVVKKEGTAAVPARVEAALRTEGLSGRFEKVILVSCREPKVVVRIRVIGRVIPRLRPPFAVELFFSKEDAGGTAFAEETAALLRKGGLPEGVSVELRPIEEVENYSRMRALEKALGVKRFEDVECFVGGRVYLGGGEEIRSLLPRVLGAVPVKGRLRGEGLAAAGTGDGGVGAPGEGAAASGLPFGEDGTALEVLLLFSPGCRECRRVRAFLRPLLAPLGPKVRYVELDVSEEGNDLLGVALLERYGVRRPKGVVLLVGDRALNGEREILASAKEAVEERLAGGGGRRSKVLRPERVEPLEERASALNVAVVAAAGLADGINPCAFATLVLFLAVLSALKSGPGKMLAGGAAFCAGVFCAYYLIGLALFGGMRAVSAWGWVEKTLHWGFTGAAVVFGALSLFDAFRVRRGGGGDMLLKVPEGIRRRFAGIMRSRLGAWGIVGGAFGAGLVIAVLEGVCTGQMYLPVISHMAATPGLRVRGHLYLLLYNGMFILPLVAVCLMCVAGVGFRRVGAYFERRMAVVKVVLALAFFSLAGAMLWYG